MAAIIAIAAIQPTTMPAIAPPEIVELPELEFAVGLGVADVDVAEAVVDVGRRAK